ncbi:MAG TPA: hypothetical protein VEJ88_03995, partial [Dissulfurispiraceae bacterium]|nr:hypothetical protein [Dissulfurispiraceae bacterium]
MVLKSDSALKGEDFAEMTTFDKYKVGFILTAVLAYASSASAGEYFCDGMDHFKTETDCSRNQRTERVKEPTYTVTPKDVEMWGEPSIDAEGRVVSKVPPAPVMKLLNDPTAENAQEYLDWNKKKVQAVEAAQQAVTSLAGKANTSAMPI